MHGLSVLGRSLDHLILLADDRQRAVGVAFETPAISHHASHTAPLVGGTRCCSSPAAVSSPAFQLPAMRSSRMSLPRRNWIRRQISMADPTTKTATRDAASGSQRLSRKA